MLEDYYVNRLSACARFPEVVEEIADGNVLEEGGFVFWENQPRFFHAGEDEFLPYALGGSYGRLESNLAGLCFILA